MMGPLPVAMVHLIKSHCLRYRLLKAWGLSAAKEKAIAAQRSEFSPQHILDSLQSASLNQLCQATHRRTMEKSLKPFVSKASIRGAVRAGNKTDKIQRIC